MIDRDHVKNDHVMNDHVMNDHVKNRGVGGVGMACGLYDQVPRAGVRPVGSMNWYHATTVTG
eukprot:366421-Chlamydomonas_euryale.AAC.11